MRRAGAERPVDLVEPEAFTLTAAQPSADLFSVSAQLEWTPSQNAEVYRVSISDTPEFTKLVAMKMAALPSLTIAGLPAETTLYWRVEAIAAGGIQVNSGDCGKFTTPHNKTAGLTFASDMQWTRESAGARNTVHRDTNLNGQPISIDGHVYQKGLWTHAFNDSTPADIVIDVSGGLFATFKATVGLDDLGSQGSVQFQLLVDGVKRAESPVMKPRQQYQLAVGLDHAKELTLRVLNGGDGYSYDHAVWALARFIKQDQRDPLDNQ